MTLVLRSLDIPVALALVGHPAGSYAELARRLHLSVSTARRAITRLQWAELVTTLRGRRHVDRPALEEFVVHGVRYAFPARRGRPTRGVPTAHAAPVLREDLDADVAPVVWPSPRGAVVGAALAPLIPSAPAIAAEWPELYDLLALVDALRIGTARDREVATAQLTARLRPTGARP